MELRERLRQMVRSFSTEVLSLWFVFLDRRVRWFTKVFLLLPVAYLVSPIDLLRDSVFFWGQADDIAVLRMSHYLFTRFLDPAVLSDSRQRAAVFLEAGSANRAAFYLALAAVWSVTILLVLQWFFKRFVQRS